MSVRVEHADMLQAIPRLIAEGVVCDAVVTDPPYHLTATLARFGKINIDDDTATSTRLRKKLNGAARLAHGFMNQQWDGGDIAFRPETWAAVASILRPGAFLIAFGGTRTYHRLVCAIEDAGFVIQDQIAWIFGTGFPKRRDMLKPAWETICIAQKPIDLRSTLCGLRSSLKQTAMSQRGMATITALSTASLWLNTLDALSAAESTSTIGTASRTIINWKTLSCCLSRITPESIIQAHSLGHLSIANASPAIRFFDAEVSKLRLTLAPSAAEIATSKVPIELLAEAGVGLEPIVLAYKPGGKRTMQVDECRVASGDMPMRWETPRGGIWKTDSDATAALVPSDSGRWPANVCHDGSDEVVAGFPQSAGQLRNTGPEFGAYKRNVYGDYGPTPPHEARGDSGSAARFFFTAKAGAEDRWGSRHPTVKPVELMRWLVSLVTPPNGTVLDPFAGSGTTAVAALAAGRNAILIEREAQYVADIRERIAFYEGGGTHSAQAKNRSRKIDHGPLFALPYDEAADALGSYHDAITAIGEQVKAGAPVPACLLPIARTAK